MSVNCCIPISTIAVVKLWPPDVANQALYLVASGAAHGSGAAHDSGAAADDLKRKSRLSVDSIHNHPCQVQRYIEW